MRQHTDTLLMHVEVPLNMCATSVFLFPPSTTRSTRCWAVTRTSRPATWLPVLHCTCSLCYQSCRFGCAEFSVLCRRSIHVSQNLCGAWCLTLRCCVVLRDVRTIKSLPPQKIKAKQLTYLHDKQNNRDHSQHVHRPLAISKRDGGPRHFLTDRPRQTWASHIPTPHHLHVCHL